MTDFDAFERRLAAAIRSDADRSVGAFRAASVAREAIADTRPNVRRARRSSSRPAGRFGRGRGITLLAAAAVLLGGGALAVGSGIVRLPSILPPVPAPSFAVVTTASPDATPPSPSATPGEPSGPPTVAPVTDPAGRWIATGTMGSRRADHTAVRLLDGRVLVVGGATDPTDTSAELYDPKTGTWTATGDMFSPYEGFPATLLQDGKVLVGDFDSPSTDGSIYGAEVYDPASGTWTSTGKMVRSGAGLATATLLRDGTVLVRGDAGSELYDPGTGSWTATRSRAAQRHSHAAILLPDGKVLVAGGHSPGDRPTASAELYDPNTGSWTEISSMNREREGIAAFLQPDGRVLVVGGPYSGEQSAELYDPATGTWTATGNVSRPGMSGDQATLLADGRVLVRSRDVDADLFDPSTEAWAAAAPALQPHRSLAILLLDGTVLVAGGSDCYDGGECGSTDAAELYVPAGVSP